jgi:Bacterial Ig domain
MKKLLLFTSAFLLFAYAKAGEKILLEPEISATVDHRSNVKLNELNSTGKPHKKYTRCVLKFNLNNKTLEKAPGIKKALLKLRIIKNTNPKKIETELRLIKYPWTKENLSWSGSPWPKPRNASKGYIDLASSLISGSKHLLEGENASFDVSKVIAESLKKGKKNISFVIKTGPEYLGGSYNKGYWEINFEKPELAIELGKDRTAEIAKRTLRFYPSAHLPPVSQPYYFLWACWSGGGKFGWDKFKYMNVDSMVKKKELLDRGILALRGVSGPQRKYFNSLKAIEKVYRDPIGIGIDEWQENDRPAYKKYASNAAIVMKKLDRENPSEFFCVFWRREKNLPELGTIPDLVALEVYTHVVTNKRYGLNDLQSVIKRIEWLKKYSPHSRTIPVLGELAPSKYYNKFYKNNPFNAEVLEEQVKTLRKKFPEMPGVGFYSRMHDKKDIENVKDLEKLALAADQLCYKYYIKPAPKVLISSPASGQKITSPEVKITAECKAKDGRTMKSYRYFIDNRLVKESAKPEFIWDCSYVSSGKHIITVHGIDSSFNMAAAQIPVVVDLKQ